MRHCGVAWRARQGLGRLGWPFFTEAGPHLLCIRTEGWASDRARGVPLIFVLQGVVGAFRPENIGRIVKAMGPKLTSQILNVLGESAGGTSCRAHMHYITAS